MQACAYRKHGAVSKVVCVSDVPLPPDPGPGQLLIRVHAASLNPADWKSAEGGQAALLSFRWPRVYGFDFSGEVVKAGPVKDAAEFAVGERVFGMIKGLPQQHTGTVAEYCLVDASICASCPPLISHAECAALPLVGITAVKMFEACGLPMPALTSSSSSSSSESESAAGAASYPASSNGPRVLITGGAGGVGSVAIQLAKAMYNASFVATTASAGAKTQLCTSLGADLVVDYRSNDFEKALANDDQAQLFQVVIDTTGEAARCVSLLQSGGGMCSIVAGSSVQCVRTWLAEAELDPKTITFGVGGFLGSSFGGWAMNKATGAKSLMSACAKRKATFASVIGTGNGPIVRALAEHLAAGTVQAVIDKRYPLAAAVDAIKYQQAGRTAGKVIVEVIAPQAEDPPQAEDSPKAEDAPQAKEQIEEPGQRQRPNIQECISTDTKRDFRLLSS